jgi:hypothetical protein
MDGPNDFQYVRATLYQPVHSPPTYGTARHCTARYCTVLYCTAEASYSYISESNLDLV